MKGRKMSFLFLLFITAVSCRAQQIKALEFCLPDKKGDSDNVLALSDGWQFYYGRHLSAFEMRHLPLRDQHFICNPQNWRRLEFNGKKVPPIGVSSYYRRVVIKRNKHDTSTAYGLRFGNVSMAYKLWVNGRFIGEVGKAGTCKEDFRPIYLPHSFYFSSDADTLDIVLHVSNFLDPVYAGVTQSIYLGDDKAIEKMTLKKVIFASFVLCTILLLFLYQIVAWFFHKFKQSHLVIAFLSAVLFAKMSMDGDLVLFHLFPDIDYQIYYRVWLVLLSLIIPLVIRLVRITFPNELNSLIEKLVYVFSFLYAFFVVTSDISFVLNHRLIIAYVAFGSVGYLFYVLAAAAMHHRENAVIHIVSFLAMFVFFINDLFYALNQQTSGYLSQLGIVQYLFIQTGILINEHARYQKQAIRLSYELKEVNVTLESTVKQRTGDLQVANGQLEKVSRQKDILISTISHDLINSFNILLNFTKYLSKDLELPEKYRDLMNRLYCTSDKGYKILENTLLWARLQMVRQSEASLITLLSYIIQENSRQNLDVLEHKKLQVDVDVDDSLFFRCDEGHLNAIIRNLLSNAVKFSYEGGKISFRNQEKDGWVQILIQDEGMGMSEEQCRNLFDNSVDVRRQGTDSENGAGIGLLIVKELVEANQGNISCISKEGEGTLFILNFKRNP
jgi:signal transduction histidine kinase